VGGYVLLVTAVFLVAILGLSWAVHLRKPRRGELLVGLFVASLLNMPCVFGIMDALSRMGVFCPEESRALAFAVGVENLERPVLLHGLVILVLTYEVWRGRKSPRESPLV